jgi:hypothetical protein
MQVKHKISSLTPLIESAFDILGTASRDKLFQYLLEKYEIDMRFVRKSDMSRIHRAIVELFGHDAAELLMKQVYTQIDKIDENLE